MQKYYHLSPDGALKELSSSPLGLSQKEAALRLQKYGKNTLEKGKKEGIVKLFLSQFKDVMTLLLIAAAVVSAVIAFISGDRSDLTDTAIILFIIFLNAAVGTAQQYRADRAIENLKKLSVCMVKCRRGGKDVMVESENLVVGDVISLDEGDMVPADCRLLSAASLKCDESALTGESAGVEKCALPLKNTPPDREIPLTQMSNVLFSSSYVISGSGTAVVTATGMHTETGKIARMLSQAKPAPTPLENSLNKLGKIISIFVLVISAVIFVTGMLAHTTSLARNFMTSVAIAVAAIPEGLPAVVTIIMAMGVQRMSKKNVVIRRLKSVETLGGCNYICTDKTGTLTENKMRVVKVTLGAGGYKTGSAAAQKLVLCMHACVNVKGQRGAYMGDPTEIAIKEFADRQGGGERIERLDELPFTSERKLMSVAARTPMGDFIFCKGAPDVLLKKCSRISDGGGGRQLCDSERERLLEQCGQMSAQALRVIGFACGDYNGKINERGLTFLGFAGMYDGLKKGVKEAVEVCAEAGVTAVMITGDHKKTAFAIAKQAGIARDISEVTSGEELDLLDDEGWRQTVSKSRVFARVTPAHKNSIVKYLQQGGNVVAMTGDGVNDAPSIKSADIGIAMGRSGTDVTKNASDMVITDDNFTTIVSAVREGRRIFSNIKKTINFFIATNLAEVLAILIATFAFAGCEFLRSTQLLWINLITDSFPVLALGVERADDYSMHRPPERAEKSLFSAKSLLTALFFGLYITGATVAVYALSLRFFGGAAASTMTFLTISFSELFHAFNIRSERASAFSGFFTNKVLIVTVFTAALLNVLLCVIPPVASVFGLTALNGVQWGIVWGVSLSVVLTGELFKCALRINDKRKKLKAVA